MARPFFTNTPYFSGDINSLKSQLINAYHAHKQYCIFGDSTTTEAGNGRAFLPELNRQAFLRFGRPSQTPWYPCKFFRNVPPPRWFAEGEAVNITAISGTNTLPDYEWGLHNNTVQGFRLGFMDKAQKTRPGSNKGYSVTNYSETPEGGNSEWVYEAIVPRDTAYEFSELRLYEMHNVLASNNKYFLDVTGEQRFLLPTTGAALNGNSNTFYMYTSPAIPYYSGFPEVSCYLQGFNGSTIISGLKVAASRFRNTVFSGGVSFVSFSFGGATANSILSNHSNAGPIFQQMGNWNIIFVFYGINHFGGDTPDAYKSSIKTFISTLRSSAWMNSSSTHICLVSPHNYVNAPDSFKQAAAVNAEIANEENNVSALNFTRYLDERVGLSLLSDNVHYTDDGQTTEAVIFWQLLDSIS